MFSESSFSSLGNCSRPKIFRLDIELNLASHLNLLSLAISAKISSSEYFLSFKVYLPVF